MAQLLFNRQPIARKTEIKQLNVTKHTAYWGMLLETVSWEGLFLLLCSLGQFCNTHTHEVAGCSLKLEGSSLCKNSVSLLKRNTITKKTKHKLLSQQFYRIKSELWEHQPCHISTIIKTKSHNINPLLRFCETELKYCHCYPI